jgi:hypothetical protein
MDDPYPVALSRTLFGEEGEKGQGKTASGQISAPRPCAKVDSRQALQAAPTWFCSVAGTGRPPVSAFFLPRRERGEKVSGREKPVGYRRVRQARRASTARDEPLALPGWLQGWWARTARDVYIRVVRVYISDLLFFVFLGKSLFFLAKVYRPAPRLGLWLHARLHEGDR